MERHMQLTICDDEVTYKWFKDIIGIWLQDKHYNTYIDINLARSKCVSEARKSLNDIFKLVGLIISDDPISRIVRQKQLRTITFKGLNPDTLYAIFYSAAKLSRKLRIVISKQNTMRTNKSYFDITLFLDWKLRTRIIYLIHNILADSSALSELSEESLATLFAGLIDGDGYIGK